MADQETVSLLPVEADAPGKLSLQERRTPELVIALVGPIASGVSITGEILKELFENEYDYEVFIYKVSKIIKDFSSSVGGKFDDYLTGANRVLSLQSIGNELRKKYSPEYLAEKCVELIGTRRLNNGYDKSQEPFIPLPIRQVHIIDSIKNPAELNLLRDVYGDIFWVFGVFAPVDVRRNRLINQGYVVQELDNIMYRDEDENIPHGQKVRDTIHLADFFARNDGSNDERLRGTLSRYNEILFNVTVSTPTSHEAAMFTAVSAVAKSACLSRQVGAAIYSDKGELIGVGWNDVPKAQGGLYGYEDGEDDHRCFKWGGKICHNDDRKKKLYKSIFDELGKRKIISEGTKFDAIVQALSQTEIRSLIEYSRSVHAEMEAIISVARGNKGGLVGSTIYTTTFPCHSCARHIVASGISKVIFIEAYPKSLAVDLHSDAVTTQVDSEGNKVLFLQYEGIAPKNVIKLFEHGMERKENGKVVSRNKRNADPVFQPPLDGFATYEQIVVKNIVDRENGEE